jgi:hypothetical protein
MTLANLGRATGYLSKTNSWKQTLEQVQNYDTFTGMPLLVSSEASGLGVEEQQDLGQPAPPKQEGGVPQSLGRSGTPPTPRAAHHARSATPHRRTAPAEKQPAAPVKWLIPPATAASVFCGPLALPAAAW